MLLIHKPFLLLALIKTGKRRIMTLVFDTLPKKITNIKITASMLVITEIVKMSIKLVLGYTSVHLSPVKKTR